MTAMTDRLAAVQAAVGRLEDAGVEVRAVQDVGQAIDSEGDECAVAHLEVVVPVGIGEETADEVQTRMRTAWDVGLYRASRTLRRPPGMAIGDPFDDNFDRDGVPELRTVSLLGNGGVLTDDELADAADGRLEDYDIAAGVDDDQDDWDPEPASLRDGETPDQDAHAEAVSAQLAMAEEEGDDQEDSGGVDDSEPEDEDQADQDVVVPDVEDLTDAEQEVVETLAEEDELPAADVKQITGYSGASHHLRELVERNVVEWRQDPDDGRRRLYSLGDGAGAEPDEVEGRAPEPTPCGDCGATFDDSLAWSIHRLEVHGAPQHSTFGDLEPGEFRDLAARADSAQALADHLGWQTDRVLRMSHHYGVEHHVAGVSEAEPLETDAPEWLDEASWWAACEESDDVDELVDALGWDDRSAIATLLVQTGAASELRDAEDES